MQQRRLRLGDIVDDYCPRERRITNHAIVAMIEDEVKQTRCTTCEADHEYKQARVPAQRRKKDSTPALPAESPAVAPRKRVAAEEPPDGIEVSNVSEPVNEDTDDDVTDAVHEAPIVEAAPTVAPAETVDTPEELSASVDTYVEDDGPVHRPLIRATLPRPEGHAPERKMPDFTMRQRPDNNGHRHGRGPRRQQAQGGGVGQPPRFGGPRHGQSSRPGSGGQSRHGSGQPPRHGSGPPHGQGNRQGPGSRPGQGPSDQQRHGRRGGRKRGR